jgi:hypothetical protein
MAIESVDRIVRTPIGECPDICEVMGACGAIRTIRIQSMMNGLWYKVWMDNSEIWSDFPPEAEFDLLVPDTLDNPVTQAEIVLALSDLGIEF